MKAISLWQPWASAIPAGLKGIETRGRQTHYRGPLAIHAAKKNTRAIVQAPAWLKKMQPHALRCTAAFAKLGIHQFGHYPRGCIVATCELVDCVPTEELLRMRGADGEPRVSELEKAWGDYRTLGDNGKRRYGWVLRNIVPLTVPVPCVGRQGFFEWEEAA